MATFNPSNKVTAMYGALLDDGEPIATVLHESPHPAMTVLIHYRYSTAAQRTARRSPGIS